MGTLAGQSWLITGGAGFIGSNLVESLLRDGAFVTVLDDLSSGTATNLDRLRTYPGGRLRFILGSILENGAVSDAMGEADIVVHLAAQVSVAKSVADPAGTWRINGDGFRGILDAALTAGVRRVVYASSAAVYGDNPDLPLAEMADLRPLSPYADSKVANERVAAEVAITADDLSITGLRFFNVYGSHQSVSNGYAAIIPAWRAALRDGRAPVIYGDGGQTRDFCHVSDAIAVIRAIGEASRPGAAVYNVGSGKSTRLLDLLEVMARLARCRGLPVQAPVFEATRPNDIRHSACDIGALGRVFGYRPVVNIQDGLARLMAETE